MHLIGLNYVSLSQQKHKTSTSCCHNDGTSKDSLHFDDSSKKVVLCLFPLQNFLTEIENMFCMFLSRYRSTHESLGEPWKHQPVSWRSHSISCFPKLPLMFLHSKETQYVFSISYQTINVTFYDNCRNFYVLIGQFS